MATFFGEIVSPASRAVDEDEDEQNDFRNNRSFYVRWTPDILKEVEAKTDKKVPCDTLIIALGDIATAFIECNVSPREDEVIGHIESKSTDGVDTETEVFKSDKPCLIYRCQENRGTIICQCKRNVLPECSFSWVSECFSGINLTKAYVCVLCSSTTSEYMSDKQILDMKPPFVKSLATSKLAGMPACSYLEQPNIVSGLPAQIMTFCEMNNIRAVTYICYSDYMFVDFAAIMAFKVVLNSTPFRNSVQVHPHCEEKIKKLVETYDAHSSLYL